MNMLTWLTKRRRGFGNLFNQVICTNQTLSSYQAVPTAPKCSTSLFSSHLSNILMKRKDCGTYLVSPHSSSPFQFVARRYKCIETGKPLGSSRDVDKFISKENEGVHYPGGKIAFTSEMNFLPGSSEKRVQSYRVLDEDGYPISSNKALEHMSKELGLKIYTRMVTLQTMDTLFYELQRQGKISFYLASFGEEAINIASAAALSSDDLILAQYREQGVLLWRGFAVQEFANQLYGKHIGHGKGRNMPIFYGSKKLNYITTSAPIATQLPQAVGVAYSLKMDKKDACVVAYFGDGTTSEGDFHASMNFAAVLEAPIVFICRNNGWAVSTPVDEQFRSDGVVVKGQAYGIQSIRVDGNDALAVYNVVHRAREIAINEQRPILIEAMTYRVGDHSASDDSTRYRSKDEVEHWNTMLPIRRFRKWVERQGWWSEKEESELHINLKNQVKDAIKEAEREEKAPLKEMFTDVYDELPLNLIKQENSLREATQRHPKDFPTDIAM